MHYPGYIHLGDKTHSHGVTLPDFPGCFSAADDFADLPKNIQEAVEVFFEGQDLEIPLPSKMEDLLRNEEYTGGYWVFFDIDLSKLNSKSQRVNITLPENLVIEIGKFAEEHGLTRSGFLAKAARYFIANSPI